MYKLILGISEYQNKIYDKLTTASEHIDEHIIKLLYYSDSSYVEHWKAEIFAFLHKIDKLKGRNKWPKSKFIKEALSTHNDMLHEYGLLVKEEESELAPRYISDDTILLAVNDYQNWLAEQLSIKGIVLHSEVCAKLDEIIKNYE